MRDEKNKWFAKLKDAEDKFLSCENCLARSPKKKKRKKAKDKRKESDTSMAELAAEIRIELMCKVFD